MAMYAPWNPISDTGILGFNIIEEKIVLSPQT